jgi:hypothetical protein
MTQKRIIELENLLHEGLNLCVRARKMDEALLAAECRKRGSYAPEHVNCLTPHLWLQEQYDADLAEWEEKTRNHLTQKEPL